MKLARALLCAVTMVCGTASAQSLFTNVSSAFRPGPYTFMKVDPTNAERFVVTTGDGSVLTTRDSASTVIESQALSARQYFPMVLRGLGGAPHVSLMRTFGRSAHRLFIAQLNAGMQTTRWASWMSLEDPSTEILDVAISPAGGHGAIAGPNGVFVSDERMATWTRALGYPRPKGNIVVGLSVAFDPGNPNVLFAGTTDGMWVSFNAGATFTRHPDKKLAEETVRRIIWDQKDPKTVFLIAGGTIYKSENRGQSFEVALAIENEINAIAQADEGVYVAHAKGLQLYSSDGTKDLLKEDPVVGVVPMGDGSALAATDTQLYLIDKDGKRSLMNTTAADPFMRLEGSPELAWALTKFGIYRIGVREKRKHDRMHPAPRLLMSEQDVQRAVLIHMGIGDPTRTRLNDRWYANFLPRLSVEVRQNLENQTNITHDWAIPGLPYRTYSVTAGSICCGSYGTTEPQALIMANWDLAKIIAGPYGNVSMPFGLVEAGLRTNRTKVLDEVRWRYREIRQMAQQLRYPPEDKKVRLFWQMRIEEYAQYIDALTGKQVVDLSNMEDIDEDE